MPGNSKHEYTQSAVSANSCNYSRLQTYNQTYAGVNTPQVGQKKSNIVIVPSYGGVGYANTPTYGTPNCDGYYSMKNAYQPSGGCTSFARKMCG